MSRIKILIVIGTRPEVIKMAPLIRAFQEESAFFELRVCDTGQHSEIKQSILDFFQIMPDYQLNALKANTSLSDLTSYLLSELQPIIVSFRPNWILVQGDTTSAMAGALAGFYNQIKIGHVEAGLRTYDKNAPYPEEVNRQIISRVADLHFAPTMLAKKNLLQEGIPETAVEIVGNTVVDALYFTLQQIAQSEPLSISQLRLRIGEVQQGYTKMILLTLHRRENLAKNLDEIGQAIKYILQENDCFALFPMHPNPRIRQWAVALSKELPNLILEEALPYEAFVWAMQNADLILTDSGGIQEEAPSLGKPVILLRQRTERPEAQQKGTVYQVSIDSDTICQTAMAILQQNATKHISSNPFGDGLSACRIVETLKKYAYANKAEDS